MSSVMNALTYQHFPIYAIMVLFLGAFLIVVFGGNRTARNILALLSITASLAFILALIKPVMWGGEIIAYWMGNRVPAGGYAIGIALEVDALSLFFALIVATAVFVSGVYSIQYMRHDDNEREYYTLFLLLSGGVNIEITIIQPPYKDFSSVKSHGRCPRKQRSSWLLSSFPEAG